MLTRVRMLAVVALAAAGCHKADAPPAAHVSAAQRDAAFVRAKVWRSPSTPIARADLGSNPQGPGAFRDTDTVECRFVPEPVGGTTPKFHCRLPSGDIVKVKYGDANAELGAEVAATRLLDALGFRTDRMYLVGAVRCLGCPMFPFEALQCVEKTGAADMCLKGADAAKAVDFPRAVIEGSSPGRKIEATPNQGWAWFELDRIDATNGGASRAELDALRLLAVLLAHWDNKAENQRLVCLAAKAPADACPTPFLIVQDLGATFGPLKIDLQNWRQVPMWSDRAACRVSMKALPFGGGTFGEHRISEEGRQLALTLLRQLGHDQLRALFVGSGVTAFNHVFTAARDPEQWVSAFTAKVNELAAGGPCPAAARLGGE